MTPRPDLSLAQELAWIGKALALGACLGLFLGPLCGWIASEWVWSLDGRERL